MKIDVHNHCFPQGVIDLVNRDDSYHITVRDGVVTSGQYEEYASHELYPSLFDPAAKIHELETSGLDAAVICVEQGLLAYEAQTNAGEKMAEASNLGMADFCAAFPDRLRWMAHAPLQAPERAAAVLREAASAGAAGVQIGTAIADRRPDAPEFERFWAEVEDLNLPVFVHPAYNRSHDGLNDFYFQNVIGNLLETTVFIERLICAGVLDRHPGVRVVLAHGGGYYPYQAGRLAHARKVRPELDGAPVDPWSYPNVYIDSICHDQQALAYLVSRVGPDRVVLGSDFPFDMAEARPIDALRAAVDADTARTIAETNPTQLFGFPTDR